MFKSSDFVTKITKDNSLLMAIRIGPNVVWRSQSGHRNRSPNSK